MEEIWKDILDYEGLYQVSNLGRVKSLSRRVKNKNGYKITKEIILQPAKYKYGYYHIDLSKENKSATKNIHKLVAIAFLNHNHCGYKLVVNHKNFDKLNNHVDNLEIVTQRENSNKKHLKSSSIYTGVCWCNTKKKWATRHWWLCQCTRQNF